MTESTPLSMDFSGTRAICHIADAQGDMCDMALKGVRLSPEGLSVGACPEHGRQAVS